MKQLLTLILLTLTLLAGDVRLKSYPQAQAWEKTAESNADSAYNLGYIYHTQIQDLQKAIELYKKAYEIDKGSDAALNLGAIYADKKQYKKSILWYKKANENSNPDAMYSLGTVYEEMQKYDEAIEWYEQAFNAKQKSAPIALALLYKKLHQYDEAIIYFKKAYEMGNMSGANGLGYYYDVDKKDVKNAILWYKKAAKKGYAKAINNLNKIYHAQGDEVKASAYTIAMINYGYSKKEVLDFLKNNRKVDQETINKAYKLQKTLDIPKHYTGGVN